MLSIMSKKKLSSKYKITSRVTPSILKAIEEFVRTAGYDYDRKFRERRVSLEHTIPILILHFLDRPIEEQVAIYDTYRDRYVRMVEAYEAQDDVPRPAQPIEPKASRAADPEATPPRKRKPGA